MQSYLVETAVDSDEVLLNAVEIGPPALAD